MESEALEAALSRLDTWRDLFALLVVVGVAGEFFVGFRYSARNKQLQAIQHTEDQQRQEAMARLHTEAETARTTAESFKLDIAKANERAASAEAKAAQFNEIAERERLARLQLEEKLRPRLLTDEQKSLAIDALSHFAGATVDMIAVGDTTEIAQFSGILQSMLASAAWHVRGPWSTMGGVSVRGVLVCTQNGADRTTEAAANLLVDVLIKQGILSAKWDSFDAGSLPAALAGPPWDSKNTAPIRIFVGEKP
jgi:hypothetical protein